MKSEIDKDFYCSSYDDPNDCHGFDNQNTDGCFKRKYYYKIGNRSKHRTGHCKNCHRKHPTPEQYKEEYGEKVPDDFPVWFIIPEDDNGNFPDWTLIVYSEALQYEREEEEADFVPAMYIVCACTPFGKSDRDWRPE